MRRLLQGRRFLEGGAYFNVNTQRCGAYQRGAFIWGPVLIRRNMVFADYNCEFFNESINRWKFSSILKYVNVTPVFKKDYRCSKESYRPVSILSVVSKILKKYYISNLPHLQIKVCQYISVVLEKATLRNIQ